MDTEDLVLFIRTVELGSLSAAGRDLRISPAVASSRIQRLESQLGQRILNRTTRQINLTPDGETFFEHCLIILKQVDAAQDAVSARRDKPAGVLKVSAPTAFAKLHIAPYIPDFVEKYPDIRVSLVVSDRITNFMEEKIDLAIRIAELKDSSFIVRKLAENIRVLCAAPEYLKTAPRLNTPEDLKDHNCLLLRFPGSQQFQWRLITKSGEELTPSVSGNMDSDNGEVLTDWCRMGKGIALKSMWEVGEDIATGRLVQVLPEYALPSHTVHSLYPHALFLPPRVRVFIDYLADTIGKQPYWEKASDA